MFIDETDLALLSLDGVTPYDLALAGEWDEADTLLNLSTLPQAASFTQKEVN